MTARKRHLTDAQRETMRYLLSDPQTFKRARSSGERVTLASLYRRGFAERRAWRGAEGSADAAHEYRPAPAVALSYARARAADSGYRAADALGAHAETVTRRHRQAWPLSVPGENRARAERVARDLDGYAREQDRQAASFEVGA